MAAHPDILEQRDRLTVPFIGALTVHVCVIALLFIGWYWMNRRRDTLGDLNPAGGQAYTVSSVHNIPIPRREAPPNPVANDTQSTVPTAPAKQQIQKNQPQPDKNAFEIAEKPKRQAPKPTHQQQYTPPAPANQVYSRSPQALSNPMYGAQSGAGQVGLGPNTPLGNNRLGWYAEIIRQKIAQNWNTNGLDARSQNAPAIVNFYIMRDGSIKNPQIVQTSGNPTIDNTALRAVYQSNPFPALPPQISEPYITAQFTFNLR
ncbi:MAG: TonB family protein [Acidobacteriaceae bacterium]|nr:TonB family protein [Acidobacteriaceae bacterium]